MNYYQVVREANDALAQSHPQGLSDEEMVEGILRYRRGMGKAVYERDGGYHFFGGPGEDKRLDIQHHLWFLTLDGKLALAPALSVDANGGDTTRALDLGTGTGMWAVDFGEENPGVEITAVDISPVNAHHTPPNVTFLTLDHSAPWPFPPNHFHYIHSRMAQSSVRDWPAYLAQAFTHLAPSGYLELQEFALATSDNSLTTSGPALARSQEMIHAAAAERGAPLVELDSLPALLAAAGFVNVVVTHRGRWPSNSSWPETDKEKEIGRWHGTNVGMGMPGFLRAALKGKMNDEKDVEGLVRDVVAEVFGKEVRAYWPVVVVYGMKPHS